MVGMAQKGNLLDGPAQVKAALADERGIERREWSLWVTAVLIILLLTLLVFSFEYPELLQTAQSSGSFPVREVLRGLVGLVLLFVVFTVYQQLQIHRIRRRLRESEGLFRLISENAADLIALVDTNGKRLYNSPSYQKVLGYTADELRSTVGMDQIHPEDRSRVREAAEQARLMGTGRRLEYRIRHKDGSWRTMESTASAICDGEGKLAKLVIINRDVTERKEAEAALSLTQFTLDNAVDSVFWMTHDGSVSYANDKACRSLSYSRHEILRLRVQDFDPDISVTGWPAIWQRLKEKGSETFESRHCSKERRIFPVEIRATYLENGDKQYVCAFARDITERKQAEKELRERTAVLHALIDVSPLAIVVLDPQHRIKMCNPAFTRLFQYQLAEIANQSLDELLAPAGKLAEATELTRQGLTGQNVYATTRRRRKDGTLVDVEVHGVPLVVGGELIGAYGLYQDIGERRRAERNLGAAFTATRALAECTSLKDATARILKSICESLGWKLGLLWEVDEQAGVLRLAGSWYGDDRNLSAFLNELSRMSILPGRGLPGQAWSSQKPVWVADNSRDSAVLLLPHVVRFGLRGAFALPVQDDEKVVAVMEFFAAGTQFMDDELLATLEGIGIQLRQFVRRERAKEELELSERKYRSLFNQIADPVFIFDKLTHHFIDCNDAVERVYGYSREELKAMTPYDLHPAEEHARLNTTIDQRNVNHAFVYTHCTQDGRRLAVEILTDEFEYQGRPAWISIVRDVTARQRAEEALRESYDTIRAIIDSSPAAIVALDTEGTIQMWNPAAERLFGWAEREILGHPNPIVPPDKEEEFKHLRGRVLSGEWISGIELRRTRKDGAPIDLSLSAAPLRDSEGAARGIMAVITDITEKRQLEQQFRMAQKMEAVGRLSGGVAHDFNNLLGVIIGYAEILLERLSPDDRLRSSVEEIRKAGNRAASLTRQLLAFSRRQVLQPRVLDLNTLVGDMNRMLQRLIGEDINLVSRLTPGLMHVKADPGQIEQVVMNLAVNARDAMPQGGTLTIETRNVELDEAFTRAHPPTQPGQYVLLAVTDTGCGMDAETQAHIFEPFFTTKERGKGTGLGLAMVYGFIKQSGGYIWVESEVGKGSVFQIYWPPVKAAVERPREESKLCHHAQASETILLVEDESSLRLLTRSLLQECGYAVLEAEGAEQAIEVAQHHQGPIHLLLTDVVMPGMSGPELAGRLVPTRAEMKVLYMSGYTDFKNASVGFSEEGAELVRKPFTRDELSSKIAGLLGSATLGTSTGEREHHGEALDRR